MNELNKVRERARIHSKANPAPQAAETKSLDSQPVLFLDSTFPKRWSYYNKIGSEEDKEREARRMSTYKNVLILYFPQMEVTQTPDFEHSQVKTSGH